MVVPGIAAVQDVLEVLFEASWESKEIPGNFT